MTQTMKLWTVEFVYLDEATPRDLHTVTVKAPDAEEAKLHAWAAATSRGDRISVTGVMPR